MTFLQNGINRTRDLVKNDIDKAWVGTSGAAFVETQTGLQTGVAATKIAVTISQSDKTNVINYTLPSTTGTGNTYREFAVIKDGVVEYNRVLVTGLEHTANEDLIFRQTFFYKNP